MKARRIIATTLLATGLAIGSANPAQAVPPGDLYNFYDSYQECQAFGTAGLQDGMWSRFLCTTAGGGGLWALYVVSP